MRQTRWNQPDQMDSLGPQVPLHHGQSDQHHHHHGFRDPAQQGAHDEHSQKAGPPHI